MRIIYRKSLLLFFIILVIIISFILPSYAIIPCQCNNPPDQCTCFIQLGDKGLAVEKIINVLKKKSYLKKVSKDNEFTPEVRQAVIKFQADNYLECTGWMDDETLDVLLSDELPDASVIGSIESWDSICFVPTDGGKKYHSDPTCSGMYNPRMISLVNAVSLGIEPCRKETCKKTIPLTYSSLGLVPRPLPDEYYASDEKLDNTVLSLTSVIPGHSISSDNTESIYIGNRKSHVFHRSKCGSVKKLAEKNKIEFHTRDEAINEGYKPCSICDP